jgi:hypothetical protein
MNGRVRDTGPRFFYQKDELFQIVVLSSRMWNGKDSWKAGFNEPPFSLIISGTVYSK